MSRSATHQNQGGGILWSCISRNSTIVVEAGEDLLGGGVAKLAQTLMQKKPTAGWEYVRGPRLSQHKLKGIKFHVYDSDDFSDNVLVWQFCCVYDEKSVERVQAQSFLEKLVILTQQLRDEDFEWRQGNVLAGQQNFAPILLQRMQEVSYYGKMAMVENRVESCRQVMEQNIDMLMEREEKLDKLDQEAKEMNEIAQHFRKGARRVRRFKMWQNAKHGVMVGTAVTAGVALVVVPPLIALL